MLSTWVAYGRLGAFATDAARELDVLGHDGHSLGVDSAQVRVLEQSDEVCLCGLLKKGKVSNLERKLADEQLRGLLVTANLTKGDGSGTMSIVGDVSKRIDGGNWMM
ncbi:hypothetical protein PRIPAC_70773 [Pristionchus pacificus]|uniref:Uncharacterized protein n=1 Tax=Pristionchus pacificus TaxID=54126 RepID=A0A2A6CRV9_PRIPA|nr:hypothetical protein PRIPAC_70773 [Pristionchus pacificus]|eukprot:PDM80826.1 hypothetical protein PRIPAC_35829 [Pristionchus pacificus]